MLFHVEYIPRENWGPAEAPLIQKKSMETIKTIIDSGKVKESGVYADERGGFFIIDIDSPEELFGFLGPMFDSTAITSHPIISIETLGKMFQELAK